MGSDSERARRDEARWRTDPEYEYFARSFDVLEFTPRIGPRFRLAPVHLMTELGAEFRDARRSHKLNLFLRSLLRGSFHTDQQMRNLVERLEAWRDSPVELLVPGDFNLPTVEIFGVRVRNPTLRVLARRWDDLGREFTPTFPSRRFEGAPAAPRMRLDYVFTNRRTGVRTAVALPLAGSDHLPVALCAPALHKTNR